MDKMDYIHPGFFFGGGGGGSRIFLYHHAHSKIPSLHVNLKGPYV